VECGTDVIKLLPKHLAKMIFPQLCLLLLCLVQLQHIDSFLVDDNDQCCACVPHTCGDVHSTEPRPVVILSDGMEVVCDTQTADGGWIVIQRRASDQVNFYQNWEHYKHGFGDVHGNFWMGLEKIYLITSKRRYELRVDLTYNNTNYFANYASFKLYAEPENYKLQVSGYSGTAGDSLIAHHNNMPFSTFDRDNDRHSPYNCAQHYHGAWWYNACHSSNLNGPWGNNHTSDGVTWYSVTHGYEHMEFTEMKIRPVH